MPRVVFMRTDKYLGPSFAALDIPECERLELGYEGIFPVQPIERNWLDPKSRVPCKRKMLPLRLGWAHSIHKSQGMTIEEYLLDIGPTELSLGLSYVGGSRAVHPRSCMAEVDEMTTDADGRQRATGRRIFPTYERFLKIGNGGEPEAAVGGGRGRGRGRGRFNQAKASKLATHECECQRISRMAQQTLEAEAEL